MNWTRGSWGACCPVAAHVLRALEYADAEIKFKAVAQAYEVLSDDDMRRKYDAGEDVTGNPGEGQEQQQGQGHWMHHGGQHVHVRFR